MERFLQFRHNHCLVTLLLFAYLSHLILAQYEHWQYYPEGPQQSYQQPPPAHPQTSIPLVPVRLAGQKRKHNEGRVEIFYDSKWGTVCDDDFSIQNAHVVCRQLGYMEAISWLPGAKFGKGEGTIWLDNVYCTGRESSLGACNSNGWGVSDCKHTEDVGVICSEKRIPGFRTDDLLNQVENANIQVEDVRIRPVLSAYRERIPTTEGYVEVKDGGVWKQICDKKWTKKNSRVICGMFGFPSEKKYNARVYRLAARRRAHTYWPYSIDCTGSEAHLSICKLGDRISTAAENVTCENGMPAVVSCNPGRAFAPTSNKGFRKAYRQEQAMVRLKGGANIGEGRVELLMNGEWGSICDDQWNMNAASVVCRELGFGSAKEAIMGARLGKGKHVCCEIFGEDMWGRDTEEFTLLSTEAWLLLVNEEFHFWLLVYLPVLTWLDWGRLYWARLEQFELYSGPIAPELAFCTWRADPDQHLCLLQRQDNLQRQLICLLALLAVIPFALSSAAIGS